MELLKLVPVLVVLVSAVKAFEINPQSAQIGEDVCNKLTKDPNFEPEFVVGKPWRIYYAWNMKLDAKCLDMTFKNATPMIINRIWNDMNEYLETEPYWDAATLLVTMGRARHEMLLFAEQGPAGRFSGVPNVVRDGNITPMRKGVPLLKFHLKLLHGGKYLLMADCQIGVTTMSARSHQVPYRAEIGGVANSLQFGDGFHACTSDKNNDETMGVTGMAIE